MAALELENGIFGLIVTLVRHYMETDQLPAVQAREQVAGLLERYVAALRSTQEPTDKETQDVRPS